MEKWTWNQEALTAMGIPEEKAAELLATHEAGLEALRTEMRQERNRRSLSEMLQGRGVRRDAADLAVSTVPTDQMELDENGQLKNGEALATQLQGQYPSLFPEKQRRSMRELRPPVREGESMDIQQMSAEEINRSWDQVQMMLAEM